MPPVAPQQCGTCITRRLLDLHRPLIQVVRQTDLDVLDASGRASRSRQATDFRLERIRNRSASPRTKPLDGRQDGKYSELHDYRSKPEDRRGQDQRLDRDKGSKQEGEGPFSNPDPPRNKRRQLASDAAQWIGRGRHEEDAGDRIDLRVDRPENKVGSRTLSQVQREKTRQELDTLDETQGRENGARHPCRNRWQ